LAATQEEQRKIAAERAQADARLAEQKRTDAENKAKGLVARDGKWITTGEADKADFVSFCRRFLVEYFKLEYKPGFQTPPDNFAYDIKATNSLVTPKLYVLTYIENPKLPSKRTFHFVRTESGLFQCQTTYIYLIDQLTELGVGVRSAQATAAAQE
jgi:hypothetical protein